MGKARRPGLAQNVGVLRPSETALCNLLGRRGFCPKSPHDILEKLSFACLKSYLEVRNFLFLGMQGMSAFFQNVEVGTLRLDY